MDRNRYADLLRVVAMGGVVYGHWLLISITYAHGRLSGLDALGYISGARWGTWLFQVMPVFFLVGGYVNARSWTAHQASGEDWTGWVRRRALARIRAGVRRFGAAGSPAGLGVFNVDMIGAGNTNPPSVALLGYAAAQTGLLLAAEPWMSRLLLRPRLWRRVSCLNATAMTVYLWHFVPAIVIAVACYPTGVLAQPAVGTALWWELRPAWFALLTAVLVPLVTAVMPAGRPPRWLPGGRGPSGLWSPALLLAGLAAAMIGLARLAIAGFAPGGHLPVLVLIAFTVSLSVTVLAGHPPPAAATGAQPPLAR